MHRQLYLLNASVHELGAVMRGALANLKVLDVTHVLAGPFCAYQMALLGANVVKIEPPDAPDCARGRGPDDTSNAEGLGLNYQVQGGNKRSLAVDLHDPRGKDIVLRLASDADVFLENYSTESLEKLGLGYQVLSASNPGLVYCSMTGYGDTGPKARKGAYDNVIQAASGIIGQCDGRKPGVSFVDYGAGYAAAFAVMAALHQRHRTGRGCHISASMLETAMALMAPEAAAAQYRIANPRGKEAGLASYNTADGRIMLGVFQPAQYRGLAALLSELGCPVEGLEAVHAWPDVWSMSDDIRAGLERVFRTRSADKWVRLLEAADLPAERIRSLEEAVQCEQLAARGYFTASPEDPATTLPLAAFSMSEGGAELTRAPPRLGQHSAEILRSLDYAEEAIDELCRDRVIR